MDTPLDALVIRVGEAAIASSETVEHLALQVQALTEQLQHQGTHILALNETVKQLSQQQSASCQRLDRVAEALERFIQAIDAYNSPPPA